MYTRYDSLGQPLFGVDDVQCVAMPQSADMTLEVESCCGFVCVCNAPLELDTRYA
jgi:hypothetical protein